VKRLALIFVAGLVFSLLVILPAGAQVNAVVGGTVTDPSGAAMAKVTVTATHVNTGIATTSSTNDTGSYEFPSLQPGSYTVSAAATGFQTYTYNAVQLGQGQQVRLNFRLELASGAQSVQVTVEADTALETTTASVGGVLAEKDILSQPVASRNVLDLVALTPGVITVPGVFVATTLNFAGVQQNQVNTTRDGMITNDGRYANGAYSGIFTSPDMVEEVQVSTNQIDPALGRGAAQVQMRTRSGSNEFHGAAFWTNNNSAFNAATYFQNLQHQPVDYANRNQFGGRVGGPIKKNKAFFFFLTDDQRYLTKVNNVATVLTAPARQGMFRYLTTGSPGGGARTNGNVFSTTPSVDLNGNVLTSANGVPLYLNSVNLFANGGANFAGVDPVWFGPQYINKYMPLPNNYTMGDGLNTAGFQWQQPENGVDGATGQSPNPNRNNYTFRFDYQINAKQKVNFVMTKEHDSGVTGQTGIPDYPAGYFGDVQRNPSFYSAAWTFIITPTLLNDFRFGHKVDTWQGTSPLDLGCCFNGSSENTGLASTAQTARASYPQVNNSFLYTQAGALNGVGNCPSPANLNFCLGLYAGMNVSSPRLTISPFWQFSDSLSWVHGSHAVQFGFEIDRTSSQSANSGGAQTTRPFVTLGIGSVAPPITTATFAGIGAVNLGVAQSLLANLAGSVANIQEQYWVNSPTATSWISYLNDFLFYRTNHANAWSGYAKDTWKVNSNFTVNVGLRYDFFGAPYQDQGLAGRPTGGQSGLFGISGTSFANAMWAPYANSGALTTAQFVGPNSPNPGLGVYNNYWKAIGPSVGVAWQLPWFRRTTVIRAGYGINYIGNVDFLTVNTGVGNFPGQTLNTTYTPSSFLNLSGLTSAGVVPVSTGGAQPFTPVPLTNRVATLYGYADNLRTPYIQSFNFSIQRELTSTLILDIDYIGNKGSELYTNQQLNDTNIFENGILNAFKITRAGGNAPLFDQMLTGITLPGVGMVNGTTLTGSQALRLYPVTNTMIANGSVGALANFFNTTPTGTGVNGGLLAHAGLPQNFIVVNPQFGSVFLIDNNGNSTYNALQAHLMKRFTHGVTGQFAYTFSKTLGDSPIVGGLFGGIRDPRNFGLSKSLLSIDRPQLFQWNVTWELPFGRNHALLGQAPHWVDQIVGGWQLASAFQWQSGVPLSFTAGGTGAGTTISTLSYMTTNTANLVGPLPSGFSQVQKGTSFVQYFSGLLVQNAPVPNFGGDPTLPGRFTNMQVVNSSGQVILANPDPGTTGNTAYNLPGLRGPSLLGFHASLSKLFHVTESKTVMLRADAINILNTPQWGYSPTSGAIGITTNIDSTSFGRITSASGNRMVTFYARFDF
jgi:hypothetical protein